MGYDTEFEGSMSVEPALSAAEVASLNAFCNERHDAPYDDLTPGIWCDWKASDDGASLSWNGSEKSYNMDEWLEYMITFREELQGKTVNGQLNAFGEDRDDVWVLTCVDNVVTKNPGRIEVYFD